jgi:hypothetical protein
MHWWYTATLHKEHLATLCGIALNVPRETSARMHANPFLWRYRTKIVRQMRGQIFCQMKQKAECILCVCTSIFVKYDGKYASR